MNWREEITKPALPLTVGGRRPTEDPFQSCFGEVKVGKNGETWPTFRGEPLLPICQLNLTGLAFKPQGLNDIAFLSVFMVEDIIPVYGQFNTVKSDGPADCTPWFVRTYQTLDELESNHPDFESPFKSFEAFWDDEVIDDYPTHDLLPINFDELGIGGYYDQSDVNNLSRTKIGGWPGCVQSEPWWDYRIEGDGFEFVLQLENEYKAGQNLFGDGAAFIARNTQSLESWALDIQFT